MILYPLNLDIAGKLCLVVGGGRVAWRKIRSLLGCNARVTVVSPAVVPEIELLAKRGELIWLERAYRQGDLAGAILAFAATDNPEVQQLVSREAEERSVLLNSADDPERCDFQVPATVRRGELLLTVSTGGGSPALSRNVRQQLEVQFGPEYGVAIYLFSAVRERLVPGPGTPEENKKVFRELLLSNILESVRENDWQKIEEILSRTLPAGVDHRKIVSDVIGFAGTGKVEADC